MKRLLYKILPLTVLLVSALFVGCEGGEAPTPPPIIRNGNLHVTNATNSVIEMALGGQFTAIVDFGDSENYNKEEYTFRYTSGNERVFAVDPATGVLTARGGGESYLRIGTLEDDKIWASCVVKVVDNTPPPLPVEVTDIVIAPGYEFLRSKINATFDLGSLVSIVPLKATFSDIVFESSDSDVAVVDEYGIVTTLSYGLVDITVSALNNPLISRKMSLHVSYYANISHDRTNWVVVGSQPGSEANLFDGNNTTYYSWTKPGVNAIPADHIPMFVIDMKAKRTVEYFLLRHRTDNPSDWLRVFEASVYGSDDGVDFTPIALNIPIPHASSDNNPTLDIPKTECRYFKFVCTDWRPQSGSSGYSMMIAEFNLGYRRYSPGSGGEELEEEGDKPRLDVIDILDFGRVAF